MDGDDGWAESKGKVGSAATCSADPAESSGNQAKDLRSQTS